MTAPLYSGFFLRQYFQTFHLAPSLRFEHVDRVFNFSNKIRLILSVVGALFVENLTLASCWLEPLLGLTIQNNGKLAFCVRVKLFLRVEAPTETGEEVSPHITLVFRRMPEV